MSRNPCLLDFSTSNCNRTLGPQKSFYNPQMEQIEFEYPTLPNHTKRAIIIAWICDRQNSEKYQGVCARRCLLADINGREGCCAQIALLDPNRWFKHCMPCNATFNGHTWPLRIEWALAISHLRPVSLSFRHLLLRRQWSFGKWHDDIEKRKEYSNGQRTSPQSEFGTPPTNNDLPILPNSRIPKLDQNTNTYCVRRSAEPLRVCTQFNFGQFRTCCANRV